MTREDDEEIFGRAAGRQEISPSAEVEQARREALEAEQAAEGGTEPQKGGPKDDSESPVSEELAAYKKEAADNYDRYLRAVADLDNFRRRAARERDDLRQYAIAGVVEELLPVVDNLALALEAGRQSPDGRGVVEGVGMVFEQLKSILGRNGLKELNPSGETFDPNQHESISYQPDPELPEGTISQVVRVGYTLNGRLIRPASVVVSSGPLKQQDNPAETRGA